MKIYIVNHIRPDYQIFPTYEKAFAFAKAKADKRIPLGAIHFETADGTIKTVYNPVPWTNVHLDIIERELYD